MLDRLATALGARLDLRLTWRGEALDRLADQAHASLVESLVLRLHRAGWETRSEVTFNVFGDRGSVDVLAWHRGCSRLLVVEVKTSIVDVQATLSSLDRKVRNGAEIARGVGWPSAPVSRLLVVADGTTSRRRVETHRATFASVLPHRGRGVVGWLADPAEPVISGVLFLPSTRRVGTRRCAGAVRRSRAASAASPTRGVGKG